MAWRAATRRRHCRRCAAKRAMMAQALHAGRCDGMEETMAAEAYCTKCRTKREIKDAKDVTTANGRHALQGTCPVCGTKLTRFVAGSAKAAVKS